MANPLKNLPNEALENIKAYYSDQYFPHPCAEMIRKLTFEYELEPYETDILGQKVEKGCGYYQNPCLRVICEKRTREYTISFEPDSYVEDSNINSGFIMGRVLPVEPDFDLARIFQMSLPVGSNFTPYIF